MTEISPITIVKVTFVLIVILFEAKLLTYKVPCQNYNLTCVAVFRWFAAVYAARFMKSLT